MKRTSFIIFLCLISSTNLAALQCYNNPFSYILPTKTQTTTTTTSSTTTTITSATIYSAPLLTQYQQCGGTNFNGIANCKLGLTCYTQNIWYSQCLTTGECPSGWQCPSTTTQRGPTTATVAQWAQCGGIGYTGIKQCGLGFICTYQSPWWSSCLLK